VFPKVREELLTVSTLISGQQCYLSIADFVCMACAPRLSSYVRQIGTITYELSLCGSFCDSLWESCHNEQHLADLFPLDSPPQNADQFCLMLFDADAAVDIPELKFTAVVNRSSQASSCFGGVGTQMISCSGCVGGAVTCNPSTSGLFTLPPRTTIEGFPNRPTPPSVDSTSVGSTLTVALGVLLVALLVLAAVGGIYWFIRRSRPPPPRGRDYFPKMDEEDGGSSTLK